ncbi:MAG: ABC transporter permease [bacterium]
MPNKIWLVAKNEYLRLIKKPSFWVMIFLLPMLYLILGLISGSTSQSVEQKVLSEVEGVKKVLIVDQADVINGEVLNDVYKKADNIDKAIEKVKNNEADVAIYFGSDIFTTQNIQIHARDTSVVSRGRFNQMATSLLEQSVIKDISDPKQVEILSTQFSVEPIMYKDGVEVMQGIEAFIVPIIAVIIYFLLVFMSSNFMLSSVSEEKENRMIETVLSIVPSKQLIWGKLLGMIMVAFTQLTVLVIFGLAAVAVTENIFPFDINWSLVDVSVQQILLAIFYILAGFLFLAGIMVGVGAAMPKFREASQFSAVFIILTILPVYFATPIIAEPAGTLARIVSFTPFTAPLILLFRTSMDALPLGEAFLGAGVVIVYVFISFYLAFKLFELGSLELSKKISPLDIFKKNKN